MTEHRFTPGPWTVLPDEVDRDYIRVRGTRLGERAMIAETEAHLIGLVCWHCGERRELVVDRPPMFGFELMGMAAQAGMVGYADNRYGRALIFCNAEHARQQMTKSGHFRLRQKATGEAS